MGLDKKIIVAGVAAAVAIAVVALINKSLSILNSIDFNDPFEVDFDDE